MSSHQWTGAPEQWTMSLPKKPSNTKKFSSALLVGAAVTGGVAGTAVTATADTAGLPTTQSMDNAKSSTVKPNSTVAFSGNLSGPNKRVLSGEQVDLQWRTGNGPWHVGGSAKTDAKGHTTVSAKVGSSAQWRLAFPGDPVNQAANSPASVVYTQRPQAPVNQRIVSAAAAEKGRPYRSGGNGPGSFDCSGLTQYAHAKVGIHLPRTAAAQRSATRGISRKDITPGDLLFFASGGHVYHAAIYAGNGKMWTAPDSGDVVKLQKIWSNNYTVGRAWS